MSYILHFTLPLQKGQTYIGVNEWLSTVYLVSVQNHKVRSRQLCKSDKANSSVGDPRCSCSLCQIHRLFPPVSDGTLNVCLYLYSHLHQSALSHCANYGTTFYDIEHAQFRYNKQLSVSIWIPRRTINDLMSWLLDTFLDVTWINL